jgi:hypothetical protein
MFLIYWPTLSDVTAESAATAANLGDSRVPFVHPDALSSERGKRMLIDSLGQQFLTCQLYLTGFCGESICLR